MLLRDGDVTDDKRRRTVTSPHSLVTHVVTHVAAGSLWRHGCAEVAARAVRERLEVGQIVRRDVGGSALFGWSQLHGLLGELLIEVARVRV